MGLANLNHLYRQVILDHAQHPRNKRLIPAYTHQVELLNPTCGDAIIVQFRVVEGRLVEVGFTGSGCSISMASASMMTVALKGQSLPQAMQLIESFQYLVGGQGAVPAQFDALEERLGDAALLSGIKQFPARYKCAVLAWKAMSLGINQQTVLDEGLALGETQYKEVSEANE